MKFSILICTILLLSAPTSRAQKINDTVNYFGVIKSIDYPSMTYKLRFVVDQFDSVVGYTISDVAGSTETKSKILGYYDRKKDSLHYKEVKILRTVQKGNDVDFCLVTADLKFKQSATRKSLWGNFTAHLNDGRLCTKGKIDLIEIRNLLKTLDKISKKYDAADNADYRGKQYYLGDTIFVQVAEDNLEFTLQDSTNSNVEVKLIHQSNNNKELLLPAQTQMTKSTNIFILKTTTELAQESKFVIRGKRTNQTIILPLGLPPAHIVFVLENSNKVLLKH
jgi:hypothetical protein